LTTRTPATAPAAGPTRIQLRQGEECNDGNTTLRTWPNLDVITVWAKPNSSGAIAENSAQR
jgi:hypothetical protein